MWFTSDNAGPAHPKVIEALGRANEGYCDSYGGDPLTDAVVARLRDIFEAPLAAVGLVSTGTAANVLAINAENNALREQLSTAEVQIAALQQENGELASRRNRDWFIAGAVVLLAGVQVGIIVPRIRWRRRSRWSDSF